MIKKIVYGAIIAFLSTSIYALPKHSIRIINKTDVDIQYVVVNNMTDIEYKDAMGTITYTLKPGQQNMWPPAHSAETFADIEADTVDMRIWERNLPLLLQNITQLNINDGCAVIANKVDRSRIFGQLEYDLTPYCHSTLPDDFTNPKEDKDKEPTDDTA